MLKNLEDSKLMFFSEQGDLFNFDTLEKMDKQWWRGCITGG